MPLAIINRRLRRDNVEIITSRRGQSERPAVMRSPLDLRQMIEGFLGYRSSRWSPLAGINPPFAATGSAVVSVAGSVQSYSKSRRAPPVRYFRGTYGLDSPQDQSFRRGAHLQRQHYLGLNDPSLLNKFNREQDRRTLRRTMPMS